MVKKNCLMKLCSVCMHSLAVRAVVLHWGIGGGSRPSGYTQRHSNPDVEMPLGSW